MLTNVDAGYAKIRVAALDAQIKELREQIKRLEKKKAIFKGARAIEAPAPDEAQDED